MARELMRFDPFFGTDSLAQRMLAEGPARMLRSNLSAMDIYLDDDKTLVVETHLPAFDPDDVSITVDGGALVIQAERRESQEKPTRKYVMRESSTSVYRSIPLPEGAQEDGITAHFADGVLKVVVPLAAPATPKKIAITTGS